ncbi:MAG TPA: VOC family protein [Gammaproteobacteria bacterium]|nr:VOC family protein [Gammaproteobacteria bacterium]
MDSRLSSDDGRIALTRRAFTRLMPACLLAPAAFAQASGIRLIGLSSFEIRVSDPGRSLGFYQQLFGMPVQARNGDRICLRVGDGPAFMAVRPMRDGESPAITQIGYAVEDFDPMATQLTLTRVGFERIGAPPITDAGIGHRMKTWIRQRGETQEVYFADDRGLIVQLSHPDYCGGAGAMGDQCGPAEPAPEGPIRLAELNHFTVFVSNGAEANRFYQQTFGLSVQAYQGEQSPVTGIGDGRQFVMYAGGGRGAGATPANIHHGSFNIHGFDLDSVRATLTSFGLTAQEGTATGPLQHYVSLRMPNRGGAEGGTPELYFTDPDGILLQLQHLSYCGGGGYLGSECL